jgi:hypothetical protein
MFRLRGHQRTLVLTRVDISEGMVERAARALIAMDGQEHLRDCYGRIEMKRALRFAAAALVDALDVRFDD